MEILLSFVLKKKREYILTHLEKKITKKQIEIYLKLIGRRVKGEPIAYLIEHKEFYDLDFIINKNVLVPRPDTELMVDEALNLVTHNAKRVTLVDVGTGSGCVIISLAKQIKKLNLLATDISKKALVVAKKNANLHKVDKKIRFYQGNLLEPIVKEKYDNLIILANLPYISKKWKDNSAETIGLKFEPKVALFADKDGLEIYEKLFKQIIKLKKNCKANITCLLEFDPRQIVFIKKMIKEYFPKIKPQIKKDLAGRNRLAIIEDI